MVAHLNGDLAEFTRWANRLNQYMDQYLFVQLPIDAGPSRNVISLNHLEIWHVRALGEGMKDT